MSASIETITTVVNVPLAIKTIAELNKLLKTGVDFLEEARSHTHDKTKFNKHTISGYADILEVLPNFPNQGMDHYEFLIEKTSETEYSATYSKIMYVLENDCFQIYQNVFWQDTLTFE